VISDADIFPVLHQTLSLISSLPPRITTKLEKDKNKT